MAVGFPAKTTFANGNTLPASDLNDVTGTLNLLYPGTSSTLAWDTWAPVLSVGWANGNGVWTAKYVQIGKTVIAQGYFVVGTTTTKGTGMTISLPVTAANLNSINGVAHAGTSSTSGFSQMHVFTNSASVVTMFANNSAGTFLASGSVNATAPITWATGSVLSFVLIYEAA